ncbi:hypothetical protein GCM10023223_51880 [Stackebrandtia albiflava]
MLCPPALGEWTPTLTVSVVIPAHNHQDKLDLVLAALAAQTYPDHLTEVVIVDDASQPPLTLPPITPTHTRLITPDPGGWGSAHAVNTGAAHTTGDVILRLDADMLTFHHHIEAHMRWHHRCDYAAVIGHKRFVDHTPHTHTPQHIHHTVSEGRAETLFAGVPQEAQWIERVIDATDRLRNADQSEAYRVFVGASGSVSRRMFEAVGGMDAAMILGGDTHFGYRLAQAGAVFIPDDQSSSWHLGRSQIQSRRDAAKRYRKPFQANRMPALHYREAADRHLWTVPAVDVVVDAAGAVLDDVLGAVGPLLAGGSPRQVRVTLVADWPDPDRRHATLDDPHAELRLIHETYRGDPRVHFTHTTPTPDPQVPYRLLLPASARTTRHALDTLIAALDDAQAGLLEVRLDDGATVRLERHAAFARARHLAPDDTDLDPLVDKGFGVLRIDSGDTVHTGVVDVLSTARFGRRRDGVPQLAPARRDLAEARRELAAARRRLTRQRRRIARLRRTPLWRVRRLVDRRARRLLPERAYRLLRRFTA